jgi:hypothetical protein
MGALLRQFGDMMAARFAAIKDRLLPEKRLRPRLGKAPRGAPNIQAEDPPLLAVADLPRRVLPQRAAKEKKVKEKAPPREKSGGRKGGKMEGGETTNPPPSLPVKPSPSEQTKVTAAGTNGQTETPWSKVVGRKVKQLLPPQKGGGCSTPARASSTSLKSGGLSPSGGGPPKKRGSKRKGKPARKSAAVTLTLLPTEEGEDKVSMAEVMKRAAGRVNLAALNIDYLRPKRSKTGGLILEISGENSAPRADALAAKLAEAMGDTKVRISWPTMWTEMRVHNLVDSASAKDVAEAIARAGGERCQAEQVRVGELREASSGLHSAWLRAPQAAAYKVAALGKVVVGGPLQRS